MDAKILVVLIGQIERGQSIPQSHRQGARVLLTTAEGVFLAEGETDLNGTVQLDLAWPYGPEFIANVYVDGILSTGLQRNGELYALDPSTVQHCN